MALACMLILMIEVSEKPKVQRLTLPASTPLVVPEAKLKDVAPPPPFKTDASGFRKGSFGLCHGVLYLMFDFVHNHLIAWFAGFIRVSAH